MPLTAGAATHSADASRSARMDHDRAMLDLARPAAKLTAAELLRALVDPSTPTRDLEARARAAYDAIGRLWEQTARVNEYP